MLRQNFYEEGFGCVPASDTTFSRLYTAWRAGDPAAQEQIIHLVWRDLHRLARSLLRQEPNAKTLQPTLLTSEVCQRLLATPTFTWQNRQHFFTLAGQVMRRLLVDHARSVQARHAGQRVVERAAAECRQRRSFAQALQAIGQRHANDHTRANRLTAMRGCECRRVWYVKR